ncbi:hypothetical protein L1987_10331 [Smallanthus sonchifolius]|uniref:Uncharacterized protein n=1 Tax=Smallanthus sonchifolius TaxID=185202 RepID=A0ACB9JRT6_9ASTR|nr:hypothetical protein L1987_10331 [Smallanthus sonchifolius]
MTTRSKSGIFKPKHVADLSQVTNHPLHTALFAATDPKTFTMASKDPKWVNAMHIELTALYKNNTWSLVPQPLNRQIVDSKWLFRTKFHSNGSIERYKARLVAQGYSQTPGLDYSYTFSPVVKASTVRVILSLAVLNNWKLHQLDVNNAFLHGQLDECVYMEQPPGFAHPQFPNHVCKLNKALYGLKQAPRAWFHQLSTFLLANGFSSSRADTSLFVFKRDSCIMYLLVYVDDLILTGNNESILKVTYSVDGLFLNQSKYAREILDRAKMVDAKPAPTPLSADISFSKEGEPYSDPTQYRSLVGALRYLKITRPDISYAMNQYVEDKELKACCILLEDALKYEGESDINGVELYMDLKSFDTILPNDILKPTDVLKYLKQIHFFPNALIAYRILLTIPQRMKAIYAQAKIKMKLINVLHMNDGNGDSSYASNSFLQEHAIRRALPFLKHTIKGMANHDAFFNGCFMIADLGCASGMNTLLVASNIIDIIHEVCQENNRKAPQVQLCLNDLFGNDFTTVFKLLPYFYEKLKKDKGENIGPCFVSAVPGSFYGRLFPDKSLHFVHSSYSIQWLSQVPEGLEGNKLSIYISKISPSSVLQAYGKQFHTDFTKFLQLRSEEIVRGGHMVLTLPGRSKIDPTRDDCWSLWGLLTKSLLEMLKEELVRESDINSFNLPFYLPCEDEVRNIIQDVGSFSVDNMNVYEVSWDPDDTDYTNINGLKEPVTKKNTAKVIRAITEPLLTSHFGDSIIDVLFKKYEKHVTEHLAINKTKQFTIVISLTKK